MDKERSLHAAHLFANTFADALAAALRRSAPGAWESRLLSDQHAMPPQHSARRLRVSVSGGLNGICLVDLTEEDAATLEGTLVPVGEEAPLTLPTAEAAEGVAEEREDRPAAVGEKDGVGSGDRTPPSALWLLLGEAMEGLGSVLTAQYGATICRLESRDGEASPRVESKVETLEERLTVALRLFRGAEAEVGLLLGLDETLLRGLHPAHGVKSGAGDGVGSNSKGRKRWMDAANLELVLDVELNVSLRFGQSQLPLREVLDLASGSVIELDRDVDDPVELLLDGKVIARGEAVIVDGNYGMRITEIPEPIAGSFLE